MLLIEAKPTLDEKYVAHCTTKYFSWPTQGDLLDNQHPISIFITYNNHPAHNKNNLYNDYNSDDTGTNLGAQRASNAPTGRTTCASATPTPTVTPTLDVPPTPRLPL
jgi:hypothetical protein